MLKKLPVIFTISGLAILSFTQCARVMAPTGGPKDTLAPVVTRAIPEQYNRNFTDKKVEISFNEYVTLKDLQKQFYVSPPMEENPEIKEKGKKIEILFNKPLKSNTTYSLNFVNSLVDVNENNPLSNLAYIFSTGAKLDTAKVNGVVYDAQTMLPVADIFVYLYENDSLEAPVKHKPDVITRTDKWGTFIANNMKNKPYKIIAIKDQNGNSMLDPGFDEVAFQKMLVSPVNISPKSDTIPDSVYRAQLPPQAKLKMFAEVKKQQYIKGKNRTEKYKMSLFFNSPNPDIKKVEFEGLSLNDFLVEKNRNSDTLTYWLKDATRKIADTLIASYTYMKTDTTGTLVEATEKVSWELPLAKGDKAAKERERKSEHKNTPVKTPKVVPSFEAPDGSVNADGGLFMKFNTPLTELDTANFKLFHIDDNDKKIPVPVAITPVPNSLTAFEVKAKWVEDSQYLLSADSSIIKSIQGYTNDTVRYSFTTSSSSKFGTFSFDFKNVKSNLIVQLLDLKYKLVREKIIAKNGITKFAYIKPGSYLIRIIDDANNNGKWDTGNYLLQVEPERVAYLFKEKSDKFQLRTGWENELSIDAVEVFSNY